MSFNLVLANAAPKTVTLGPGAPQQAAPAATTVQTTVAVADPTQAPAQQPPVSGAGSFMLPLVLMGALVLMFVFSSRSNKKQQQKRQQMLDAIVKGTKVMLNTGIYGTVVEVRDKTYLVEIADKVVVETVKGGVAEAPGMEATAEKK